MSDNECVVVLSGGQDSATCMALAVSTYAYVHAITFDYGQRHRVELECAAEIARSYNIKSHKVLDVSALSAVAVSALTNTVDAVGAAHPGDPDLPASFVPNRNAMFLTLAHAYAQKVGAGIIMTGVSQEDNSGYPDCRQDFIEKIGAALNSGSGTDIEIQTPLLNLDKAQIWNLADELDALEMIVNRTHTCYEGDHDTFNAWGYGCRKCPACVLREKGWHDFRGGRK